MTYEEPGCTIVLNDNRLTFSGMLERSDYKEVAQFLRQVDKALSAPHCIIDLVDLVFMNSSGIETLAIFVLGSPKTFEIRINPNHTWQATSIEPLQALKSEGISVVWAG